MGRKSGPGWKLTRRIWFWYMVLQNASQLRVELVQPVLCEGGWKMKAKVRSRQACSSKGRLMKIIRLFSGDNSKRNPLGCVMPSYSSRELRE